MEMRQREVRSVRAAARVLGVSAALLATPAGADPTWVQGPTAPAGLRARSGHGMAYDPGRGRVVLHGGQGPGGLVGDTWEFDGVGWIDTGQLNIPRKWFGMTYHEGIDRVVIANGYGSGWPYRDDGWAWDGTRWTYFPTPYENGSYSGYVGPVMTYAPGLDLLFWTGGCHDHDCLDWVSVHNGVGWLSAPSLPVSFPDEGLALHGMAPDVGRNVVLVAGGTNLIFSTNFDRVWEYDGSSWQPGSALPLELGSPAMAWDPSLGRVVLHGGFDSGGTPTDQTLEYDGIRWRPGAPTPPGLGIRGGHQMVYSVEAGGLVLFGGRSSGLQDDTWVYRSCLRVGPQRLPGGSVNTAYQAQSTVTGGTPPYNFALTSGALPPGIVLSAGGLFSGTPTVEGAYTFGVTVTDVSGCAVEHTFHLVVEACFGLSVTPPSLDPGTEGVPFLATLTATGGTPPYSFTLTGGSLPPGLSLSPTGVISGVPSPVGVYPFSVAVTDGVRCGNAAYTLTIRPRRGYVLGEGLGPANGNRVRVYDAGGAPTPVDFSAYNAGQWGTNVSGGPIARLAPEQILTGPGPGPAYGPHVRGFDETGAPLARLNYYAYATLKYGVNVSGVDVDADGWFEILSGAGPGGVFGPHVRGWNVDGGPLTALARINFFAFGTPRYGVNVSGGDIDRDLFAELLVGAGPGAVFAATVRGFDYDDVTVAALPGVDFNAYGLVYGVGVAGGDVDDDGWGDIATAPGPGPLNPTLVRGFQKDGGALTSIPGFDVSPVTTLYGGRVGLGDLSFDGAAELLVGAGRDPAADASARGYRFVGSLDPLNGTPFLPFTGSHGVNIGSAGLGY